MTPTRVFLLAAVTMIAFAGNSLLCRLALRTTAIDAASFTSVRLLSAALVLFLLAARRRGRPGIGGNPASGFALFAYAAAFSFAYRELSAATGALLLFGAVQLTMLASARARGETFGWRQSSGSLMALVGLGAMLLPGLAAPPMIAALLMLIAGAAWGVYSLRGRDAVDPIIETSGNFLRALPWALAITLLTLPTLQLDASGLAYAIASGAITSGLGYALWYTLLPRITTQAAATLQLSVPVIAAIGGVVLIDEPLTARLLLASIAVLGGVALTMLAVKPRTSRNT